MSGGFSSTELQTALNEVASWGLDLQQPYQILPDHLAPKGEARAQINLLEEGHSAVIGVSDKGWKIALRTIVDPRQLPADNDEKEDATYDTLDNLLAYLSPRFEQRRLEELTKKLEAVQAERREAA